MRLTSTFTACLVCKAIKGMESASSYKRVWWRQLEIHIYGAVGVDHLQIEFVDFFSFDRALMGECGISKSAHLISLEGELKKWFVGQGISVAGVSRVLQLLEVDTLLAEPRPTKWNRRRQFGVQERC